MADFREDSVQPLTEILADNIVGSANVEPTAAQLAAARRILIDWLGVALAGSQEPVARIMRDEFAKPSGEATILGSLLRASPADAALVNGASGHALDYDDVQEFVGHPGAVVVPAALAVAEVENVDGLRLLRAIITGFDAARYVGTLAMPGHYDRGFHSTATICTFGAAAAACHLMRLGEQQTAYAIGLAATQAAGLKAMFGTMAKPFHAGRAASAGVTAARLAARGMEANSRALETGQGFLDTQAHQAVPAGWMPPAYGESLHHLLFKFHASCYLTHSSIEALRQLKIEHGVRSENVSRVVLRVPAGHLKVCNIEEPRTGLETKFSLRHIAAMVLSGYDTAELSVFSDKVANEPTLRELRRRVEVRGDLDAHFETKVEIALAAGMPLSMAADVSKASFPDEELDRRLDKKFRTLVGPIMGDQATEHLLTVSYTLAKDGLGDLLDAIRGPA